MDSQSASAVGAKHLRRMPQMLRPYEPHETDVIFALDAHYAGDLALVALDVQTWAGDGLGTHVGIAGVTAPYVPGLLRLREGPPLLAMIEAARERLALRPDLILVDGHGTAHPRRFGLACWVGVNTDVPTIGCAKSTLLQYNGEVGRKRGDVLLIEASGEVVGAALVTRDNVRPVFVSPGHLVDLPTVLEAVLHLSGEHRVPEPLRRADQAARSCARGTTPDGVTLWGTLTGK